MNTVVSELSDTRFHAQFDEFVAARTAKQDYINILLMLLCLCQACDHNLCSQIHYGDPLLEWKTKLSSMDSDDT